jgi:Tol biopolymer transport system component
MKIRFLLSAIVLGMFLIPLTAFSQKEEADKIKMAQAWMRYNEEDYRGALRIYRELKKVTPDDAMLNFRMGQCFIEVHLMDSALLHLEKAIQNDTTIRNDAHYMIGQAYQYIGDLSKAIEHYMVYKSKLKPKQNERDFVNVLLQQCYTARENMENPVNVKIANLSTQINSPYVDANPCVSADGKRLVFSARRPENTGGKIDPWTEDYYDDIYIANYNEKTKSWQPAVNIGSPINTEFHDASLSISPDGNTIFIYKNIENITKSGDIYFSTIKPTGEWNEPKPIDLKYINTSYFESSASITADGNTLYFVSERKEGFGQADIYMSKKEGREWGKPVNLGPVINTPYDEIGVFIHPDGKTLFFSSNGHKTMGGYDLFMSTFEEGKWSEPINLGYPINTTRDEVHFVLTADRKNAYISSTREGGYGSYDIYHVDMNYYFRSNKQIPAELATSLSGPPLCILRGTVVDAVTSEPIKANLIIRDLNDDKDNLTSSNDNGEYFITLPADHRIEVEVKVKGYKALNTKFKLPKSESGDTPTMIKHLLLNKE